MAEDEEPAEGAEDEDSEGGEGSSEEGGGGSSGGKRKLILIVAAALLLVVGGLGAAYFTGLLDPVIGMFADKPAPKDQQPVPQTVFYDVPELLVNLNAPGRRATFLKIRVSLELAKAEDIPRVEQMMPRVVDNFQVYLREVRVEDLNGSAGLYRLREELMARVSAAVAPAQVRDVLFKEMLVQ